MNTQDLMLASGEYPIIVFDGECIMCNNFIQWIIARDNKQVFRYACLQNIKNDQNAVIDMDSVLLFDKGQIYKKSDVSIRAMSYLKPPFSWLKYTSWVPKFIRDKVYDIIAINRYRWFGKKDQCMIPTNQQRALFL